MRRWLVLPVVTLAVLAARPVGAEDPKTYTIPIHETWKVNDVVSRKSIEKKVQKQTIKGPDGSVLQEKATEEVEAYEGTMKVLEVDAEGNHTKALIHFKSWSRKVGEEEDTSLEGKHVEVNGTGEARTAKVLTPGADVSPEALTWIDTEFGKGSAKKEKSGEVMVPKKPMAVGETFEADPAELVKALDNENMSFVSAKSTGKFTLKDVKDGIATIDMALSLQADAVSNPQGKIEWKDGGVFTMNMTGTKPLDAGNHASTSSMTGGLKGALDAQGVTVELDIALEGETVTTVGGEMPAVPAAGGMK